MTAGQFRYNFGANLPAVRTVRAFTESTPGRLWNYPGATSTELWSKSPVRRVHLQELSVQSQLRSNSRATLEQVWNDFAASPQLRRTTVGVHADPVTQRLCSHFRTAPDLPWSKSWNDCSASSEDCRRWCRIDSSVFQSFVWLGYANSALNPVIYTIFNVDFRRAFRRILHRPCSYVSHSY